MKGWKTKVGLLLIAVGEATKGLSATMAAPELAPEIYLKIGEVLVYAGGIMTAWGVAHKIQKAGEAK